MIHSSIARDRDSWKEHRSSMRGFLRCSIDRARVWVWREKILALASAKTLLIHLRHTFALYNMRNHLSKHGGDTQNREAGELFPFKRNRITHDDLFKFSLRESFHRRSGENGVRSSHVNIRLGTILYECLLGRGD